MSSKKKLFKLLIIKIDKSHYNTPTGIFVNKEKNTSAGRISS